jgi:hypothetical protein
MLSAKQEIELIESMICETKGLLARHICRVRGVQENDEAIARMVARLNILYQLKDAMKERGKSGLRIH